MIKIIYFKDQDTKIRGIVAEEITDYERKIIAYAIGINISSVCIIS